MDQSDYLDLSADQNGNTVINNDNERIKVIKSTEQITAEFRLALFGAALYSLKSTTVLKPYPSEYFDLRTKEIDHEKLREAFTDVPSLRDLTPSCPPAALDLLYWIVTHGTMKLLLISITDLPDKAKTKLTENLSNLTHQSIKPHYIFQVTEPTARRAKIETFSNLKSLYGSFFAFHGSALENYHSILHHGLAINLNKRSLFGFGTYLSSKLAMGIEYSPFGNNLFAKTRKGLLGRKLSCVALCEVIDHPDVESKKKREKEMPSTYYVVSNNDLIRVAYLLVYSSQNNDTSSSTTTQAMHRENSGSALVFILIMTFVILIGYMMTKNGLDH